MGLVGGTIRTTHSWSPCVPLTAAHLLSTVTQQPQTACGLVQLSYRWSVILIKTPHWDPPGNWMHNGTMCRRAPLICEKTKCKRLFVMADSVSGLCSQQRKSNRKGEFLTSPALSNQQMTIDLYCCHVTQRWKVADQQSTQQASLWGDLALFKSHEVMKKNAKRTLTMFPLEPAFPSTPGSPCRHQELMMNLSEIEHFGKERQSDAWLYLHADLQYLETLWGRVNHEYPACWDMLKHHSKWNKKVIILIIKIPLLLQLKDFFFFFLVRNDVK